MSRLLSVKGPTFNGLSAGGTSGAPLRTFAVGSLSYAAALSPDGKRAASDSFDGLVRLWDTATGRHLLTLLAVPRGDKVEWLAVTPEGYAAVSPELAAVGAWRMGTQPLPAEGVWKALSNPSAVARAARGEATPAPAFGK